MGDKIGDKVEFFDENNKPFTGIIEKINGIIRVSRKMNTSQLYISIPKSTDKKIKPRWNSIGSKKTKQQTINN